MANRGGDVTTLRAGLIGEHISRTRLPKALKIMCDLADWGFEFDLIDTAERPGFDFDAQVRAAQDDGWTGVTVTHPWKTHARRFAGDSMAAEVAHLGASNTLVFRDGVTGFNTDYTGFLAAFHAAGLIPGRVVMIGAGGVAEALAPALVSLGAEQVLVADLNAERARELAETSGGMAVAMTDIRGHVRSAQGLVNATPLGMAEYPGSAFHRADLGAQDWAFDAVYTPTDTQFLNDATQAGLTPLTGFELFRHMAIGSFRAYTGLTPDPADILPKLEALRP